MLDFSLYYSVLMFDCTLKDTFDIIRWARCLCVRVSVFSLRAMTDNHRDFFKFYAVCLPVPSYAPLPLDNLHPACRKHSPQGNPLVSCQRGCLCYGLPGIR